MLRQQLAEQVRTAVSDLLQEAGVQWPPGLAVEIEQPARLEHGDYATNVALRLARTLRRPPIEIAAAIGDRLQGSPLIARAEAVPPGFVNLFLQWRAWAEQGPWYAPPAGRQRTKVVVEHTSINPNKAAHIGHLRNAVVGDTLARLLRRTGYQVEVHNYIDDLGNQVADTVLGLTAVSADGEFRRFGDFCWEVYARVNQAIDADPTLQQRRTEVLQALEEGVNNTAWLGELVAERIVREHLAEMAEFGIDYDLLVWESSIVREGFWETAFAQLRQSPLVRLETEGRLQGCWVLRPPQSEPAGQMASGEDETPSDHGLEKVLVRSSGVLTYTAKDIAYHLWKFGLLGKDFRYGRFQDRVWTSSRQGRSRPFGRAQRVLNVIDRRQAYPQAMVKLALEALGHAEAARGLHHVAYGVVSLSPGTAARLGIDVSDGRAAYPMSGRQGIGVKIADLLQQMEQVVADRRSRPGGISSRRIAAAAVRYYLLRHSLETEIVFDLDQATEVTGNTGVYLLYAHARAAGILRRGGFAAQGSVPAPDWLPEPGELHETERALLRHLADWPDTLEQAAADLAPNLIAGYAYELASRFSHFYTACPVLPAAEPLRGFRLWLTALFRATLADALELLGLPRPARM